MVRSLHGVQLGMAGDLWGSIKVLEDVMASSPGFGFGYGVLAYDYHLLGERDKAIAALATDIRLTSSFPEGARLLEDTYAESGYTTAILKVAQALEERSKSTHVGPLAISHLYEYAGETEKAVDWFEVGYQVTGPGVPYLGVFARSPELQSNARFIKLLRDINLDYWADRFSEAGG